MRTPLNRPTRPGAPAAGGLQLGTAHGLAIAQSHERCVALGVSRIERPDFTPLGRADLGVAVERNRRLHEHAAPVMEMLHEQIVNSQSLVALTDATGTVLHSIGDDDFLGRANQVALRPGVNWSESTKGTNAVGTALVEEAPTLVHADEHYLHANHFLTCSAAPILDPRGNMLGVLDVSGDHRSYHPHTMALVKMSVRMIENRWFTDHFRRDSRPDGSHLLRLHFHSRPEFIGTLMEGIIALGADGRVIGANRSALEQLGTSNAALRRHTLHTLLGSTVGALVDRLRNPLAPAVPLHLADGRCLHVRARFNRPQSAPWADPQPNPGPVHREPPAVAALPAPPALPPLPAASALHALRTGCAVADAVIDKLSRVADRQIPVLLLGDTGTGKATLARALHADSSRRDAPFVAVHCASLPAAALEAALFGSEGTPGHVGAAHGGTLLLSGIGALPSPAQARLLHLLQQGLVLPLGNGPATPVDVKLVCATQRPLREQLAAGSFRDDLFYRLNGLTLRLPPLRERSDIEVLARRLLDAEPDGRGLHLAPDVSVLLRAHRWPGNLRQLGHVLRSACAMAAGERLLTRAHLPDEFLEDAKAPTLEDLELDAIRRAVQAAGGNISVAARALGISRNTIYRKLRWKPA